MVWVAKRMESKPGRLQVAVEWMYELMQRVTRESMSEQMAKNARG